jgi:hypothetical protein
MEYRPPSPKVARHIGEQIARKQRPQNVLDSARVTNALAYHRAVDREALPHQVVGDNALFVRVRVDYEPAHLLDARDKAIVSGELRRLAL